jgi:hypothetical protein
MEIYSRRLRRAGHVARMEERCVRGFGGETLQDPGLSGSIILKCVFDKWDGACTGSIWLRILTSNVLDFWF